MNMIRNLFSSFDPSSCFYLLSNWSSSLLFIPIVTSMYWLIPSRLNFLFTRVVKILNSEFKTLLGPNAFNGRTLIFIGLFLLIVTNNFLGLYPYIFTSTSHLAITLSLSLPLWLSFIIFGWINYTKHIFAHLVPQSTPGVLIPFIVVIETISNIIRPGTLAVRLAANIIAGHLLMTLLGNQTASVGSALIGFLLVTQIILLTLESAVAIIQSYVFAVLTTLYSSEITTH